MFALKNRNVLDVVVHPFNPSTRETEAGGFLKFEAILVYKEWVLGQLGLSREPLSWKTQKNKIKLNLKE